MSHLQCFTTLHRSWLKFSLNIARFSRVLREETAHNFTRVLSSLYCRPYMSTCVCFLGVPCCSSPCEWQKHFYCSVSRANPTSTLDLLATLYRIQSHTVLSCIISLVTALCLIILYSCHPLSLAQIRVSQPQLVSCVCVVMSWVRLFVFSLYMSICSVCTPVAWAICELNIDSVFV